MALTSVGPDAQMITGRAYPARSSHEIPARLIVGHSAIVVTTEAGEVLSEVGPDDMSVDMPVGRAPRRITLSDGTLFETEDHQAVRQLTRGSFWEILHVNERFSSRLLIFVALAFVGGWMIWRFALPAIVTVAVWLTPPSLERAIDRGTIESMDYVLAEPSQLSAAEKVEVQASFDTLLLHLPEKEQRREYTLLFRDFPGLGPNAFALPGGTVVMTDAMVRAFNNPDLVAGVLAHEIGHVVEEHGLRQIYQSLGVYVLVALIAGDTGPILEDVLLEGGVLLSLSYSRAHEREADEFGIRLADEAGFNPAGLLAFFEHLPDAREDESNYLSTHPASGERIRAIEDYLNGR